MKITQFTTTAFIIAGLLIYILYLTQCKGAKPCPPAKTKVVVDTSSTKVSTKPPPGDVYQPGDTILITKKIIVKGKDSLIFVEVEIVKEIPQQVDTQAIIQAYYSKRVQKDSIITKDQFGKPSIKVHTTDTVYHNQIIGRVWDIQDINKTEVLLPKAQFYIGGGGYTSVFMNKGISPELISAAHLDFGYINKKGQHLKIDLMRSAGKWHQGLSIYHTFGK